MSDSANGGVIEQQPTDLTVDEFGLLHELLRFGGKSIAFHDLSPEILRPELAGARRSCAERGLVAISGLRWSVTDAGLAAWRQFPGERP